MMYVWITIGILAIANAISFAVVNKRFKAFLKDYLEHKKLMIKNDKILEKDLGALYTINKRFNEQLNKVSALVKTVKNKVDVAGESYKHTDIDKLETEIKGLERVNLSLSLELNGIQKKYKELVRDTENKSMEKGKS